MKHNSCLFLPLISSFFSSCLSNLEISSSSSHREDFIYESAEKELVFCLLSGKRINNYEQNEVIDYYGLRFYIPKDKLKELLITQKKEIGAFISPANFEYNYPFFLNGFVKNDTQNPKGWIIIFSINHNFNFSQIIDNTFKFFFKLLPFPSSFFETRQSNKCGDIEKFCICMSLLKNDTIDCIVEKLNKLDFEIKTKLGLLIYSMEKFESDEYDMFKSLFKESFEKAKSHSLFFICRDIPEVRKKYQFLHKLNIGQIGILLKARLFKGEEINLLLNHRSNIEENELAHDFM